MQWKENLWSEKTASREHYSAERMRLAVLGGESLQEMESWVTTMFSDVSSGLGSAESNAQAGKPFEVNSHPAFPAQYLQNSPHGFRGSYTVWFPPSKNNTNSASHSSYQVSILSTRRNQSTTFLI